MGGISTYEQLLTIFEMGFKGRMINFQECFDRDVTSKLFPILSEEAQMPDAIRSAIAHLKVKYKRSSAMVKPFTATQMQIVMQRVSLDFIGPVDED